jgi:flagellar assembly factor FliW
MTRPAVPAVEFRAVSGSGIGAKRPARTTGPPPVVESRRFGRLEMRPETVITCSSGLLGFEEFREYVLVQPDGLEPLSFLVACRNTDVAFPVVAAALCQPGYAPVIPAHALETVGAASDQEIEILAICTMAPDTGTLHANLRGPVVLNPTRRLACQVVLDDGAFSLRHLVGAG